MCEVIYFNAMKRMIEGSSEKLFLDEFKEDLRNQDPYGIDIHETIEVDVVKAYEPKGEVISFYREKKKRGK